MRPSFAAASRAIKASSVLSFATAIAVLCAAPADAEAVRFTLGLASGITPIVIDDQDRGGATPFRLGFQPVLEVEATPGFAIGAYAPFVVLRTGEVGGTASSGAESVFALTASGRYLHILPGADRDGDRELMVFGTARGGFAAIEGRAGLFLGGSGGVAYTWLDTGRGIFASLDVGHADVDLVDGPVDRWLIGATIGVVFRLGGESWRIGKP